MAAERSSAGCSRLEEFPVVEERSSLGRAVSDIDWNDFDEVSIVGITRLAVLVLIAALSLFVYTMAASEPLMFSEPMHNLFFMADQSQSGLRRPGAKQYLALCGAQVVVLVLLVGTMVADDYASNTAAFRFGTDLETQDPYTSYSYGYGYTNDYEESDDDDKEYINYEYPGFQNEFLIVGHFCFWCTVGSLGSAVIGLRFRPQWAVGLHRYFLWWNLFVTSASILVFAMLSYQHEYVLCDESMCAPAMVCSISSLREMASICFDCHDGETYGSSYCNTTDGWPEGQDSNGLLQCR